DMRRTRPDHAAGDRGDHGGQEADIAPGTGRDPRGGDAHRRARAGSGAPATRRTSARIGSRNAGSSSNLPPPTRTVTIELIDATRASHANRPGESASGVLKISATRSTNWRWRSIRREVARGPAP